MFNTLGIIALLFQLNASFNLLSFQQWIFFTPIECFFQSALTIEKISRPLLLYNIVRVLLLISVKLVSPNYGSLKEQLQGLQACKVARVT